jgi:Sel1 repeat
MEHVDTSRAPATRPLFSNAFAPSPHRRAWFSALAFGVAASFASVWGNTSRASSTQNPSVSDAAAFASNCEQGDAVGCNDLGVSYLHGYDVPADATRALQSFERSCRDGSPEGCSNLGALYESGVGADVNLSEAARLYEQACSGGSALGCSNLGALYARGLGVARDRTQAQRLFESACQGGSAAGCNNLMHSAR